jgi:glycosyltransferase involved in cell wall biosynthesis
MKIAEVSAVFPPVSGGTGFVCLQNAQALAKRGHDVTVFTIDFGKDASENDPVGITMVRLRPVCAVGRGAIVPQLTTLLRDFDLVHLHYPFFGGAEYVCLASLLYSTRYVITYHNDVFGDSLIKKVLIPIYEHLFLKKIMRKAEIIFGLSLAHLKSTKAATMIDWSKVHELPNGVDVDIFSPRDRDSALVERFSLKDKIVILFVGHLIPLKGLHVLIQALARIPDERLVLLVIGEGYADEQYKTLVIEMKLQSRVIFAGGSIPHETELPRYFNTCDFLVMPSTESESFSLVVIEAMASAKPVIVSSLPGPSELVSNGIDGLIADVGNSDDLKMKIEYLSENPDRRSEMGIAARQKVLARYNARSVEDRLEESLRSVAAR